jgi:3'-phosphoadenosine 5'-phosphosulfate sulfotransferase (PAPS reductase)/FAD synthetase
VLLLESQTQLVIENIQSTEGKEKDKKELINYYQNNIDKIYYKRYRQIGCDIIGLGAIESAHRTVIQKRIKLSEQHWNKNGSQNMLQLRIISMNKPWHKVIDRLKDHTKMAA